MKDRTAEIFGNPIDAKTVAKAEKSKAKYLKKYGDDTERDYPLQFAPIETLDFLDASNIVCGEETQEFDPKGLIVGNIRMGFGPTHARRAREIQSSSATSAWGSGITASPLPWRPARARSAISPTGWTSPRSTPPVPE